MTLVLGTRERPRRITAGPTASSTTIAPTALHVKCIRPQSHMQYAYSSGASGSNNANQTERPTPVAPTDTRQMKLHCKRSCKMASHSPLLKKLISPTRYQNVFIFLHDIVRCPLLSYPTESAGDRCRLGRNFSLLAKRVVTQAARAVTHLLP